MRVAWLLAVQLGCGRVGFDLPGGGAGGACTTDSDCHGCGVCSGTCQPFGFTQLLSGHRSTIGLASDGTVWGWGQNEGTSLGIPGANLAVPVRLTALEALSSLAIGNSLGAGIAPDGTLWTWGSGSGPFGPLVATTDWHEPAAAAAWGCALHGDRSLWCWGDGTNIDSAAPIQLAVPPVASYAIDAYLGCAIDQAGAIWCWGDNAHGAAGDPTPGVTQIQPRQVGTATDWRQLAVGGGIVCALHAGASTVDCWGEGYNNGQTFDTATPMPVDARTDWRVVRSNFYHSCAIAGDGGVWCWGGNTEGQLGQGDILFRVSPTPVVLPGAADDLVLGGHTSCARIGAAWWCWGRNDAGELGTGRITPNVLSPVLRCP